LANVIRKSADKIVTHYIGKGSRLIWVHKHVSLLNGARSLANPLRSELLIAELKACIAPDAQGSQKSAVLSAHQLSVVS
jgi:hypothetical protein